MLLLCAHEQAVVDTATASSHVCKEALQRLDAVTWVTLYCKYLHVSVCEPPGQAEGLQGVATALTLCCRQSLTVEGLSLTNFSQKQVTNPDKLWVLLHPAAQTSPTQTAHLNVK